MSLQQGEAAVRGLIVRRNGGFFAGYRRSPNNFGHFRRMIKLVRLSAQRPNTTLARTITEWHRPPRVALWPMTVTDFLAHSLTWLHHLNPARLDLKQSFKRQHFQALRLRSVLAGPTPPPI